MSTTYQIARIRAARTFARLIEEENAFVVLEEAAFFVVSDTLRDVLDPQGAAARLYYLLDAKDDLPLTWTQNPCVYGLLDELHKMEVFPMKRLAVSTIFQNERFCAELKQIIQRLQQAFPESSGATPDILQDYFDHKVLIR